MANSCMANRCAGGRRAHLRLLRHLLRCRGGSLGLHLGCPYLLLHLRLLLPHLRLHLQGHLHLCLHSSTSACEVQLLRTQPWLLPELRQCAHWHGHALNLL